MIPPNPVRVASRFVLAGLASEARARFDAYLSAPFDAERSADLARWFTENFAVSVSSTPRGGKALKELAGKILWVLRGGEKWGGEHAEQYRSTFEADWRQLSADLDRFVVLFSSEGGREVPASKTVSGRTYLNLVGFSAERFDEYVGALEEVFAEVKGWRRGAFAGGLKVALAGPSEFRGTASGVYRSREDTMYVRATPKVLKRSRGTYGAFDYIVIHELGHRYERLNRLPVDFDRMGWRTTRYSWTDGEAFAELFALSNFGLTGTWDAEILTRFEATMSEG